MTPRYVTEETLDSQEKYEGLKAICESRLQTALVARIIAFR